MRKFLTIVPAAALLLSSACADTTGPIDMERADGPMLDVSQSVVCQPTGLGLTANYINTVPSDPFVVTCDIGIFFDQPGTIDGAHVMGTVADAKPVQFGIYIAGVSVDVVNSTVQVDEGYPHQFISMTYRAGASGTIRNNELRGAHRAAIVLRGAGTSATVRGNLVVGSGPKTSGWAENGLQIDQGATANVVNNTFEGHWWDGGPARWASTAALVYSDGVTLTNNRFVDNEFSIFVWGSGNTVTNNRTSSQVESENYYYAYGALLFGADNSLTGNRMTAVNGAAGLYIYAGSANNHITGNRFDGFFWPIYDGGDGTMIRGKPTPVAP